MAHYPMILASANARLVVTLYVGGCVLQLLGAVIVAVDLHDDRRRARNMLRELHPLRIDKVDELVPQFAEHLSGASRRRIAGVALIVLGAVVGLAANLFAFYS